MRIAFAVCLIFTTLASAQEKRLTFEVASIKPAKPDESGGSVYPKPAGQGYGAEGATVRLMISVVYSMPIANIRGGPVWLDNDVWNVEAKADHAYSLDDLHRMFQNLLADEFKLKFHEESKQGPIYALTVNKSGSKMKVNDSPENFEIPPIDGHIGGVAVGKRVRMEYLCSWLKRSVLLWNDDRPVIDKTGLT
ncbi:MAG: TIGR03435 family protein, partial [Bryobacteraceae bacterium]